MPLHLSYFKKMNLRHLPADWRFPYLQEAESLVLSASQYKEPCGSNFTVFAPAVAARLNNLLDALDKQVRPIDTTELPAMAAQGI